MGWCVCMHMGHCCVPWYICGSQRTTLRVGLYLSATGSRDQIRVIRLCGTNFTHRHILPAPLFFLIKESKRIVYIWCIKEE